MNNEYRPAGKEYLHVNDNPILKIDKNYIAYLKNLAQENEAGKCTMCLHNDTRAHVHEMVNVYPEGTYVRPHWHPLKSETKVLIEGKLYIIIFDEIGRILEEFIMERDGIFTFRMEKGIIHTNIPLTDCVFQEVIEGPFIGKDDSMFPIWAPELDDEEGIRKIMNRIRRGKQNIK